MANKKAQTGTYPQTSKGGGASKKKTDSKVKAKRSGWRLPGTSKTPTKAQIASGEAYFENRKNRSDANPAEKFGSGGIFKKMFGKK